MTHRKRVLIASDDSFAVEWARRGLDLIDAESEVAALAELAPRLGAGDIDAVFVDAGRNAEAIVSLLEQRAAQGVDVRALLALEADALPALRMPVTFLADFVVRGAQAPEIAARLRTLLWPGEEARSQDVIRVDGLSVNLATYQVQVSGVPVEFTFQEYELFKFLLTHPNRVYGREVLLRRVWDTDYFGGARTIDVHVRRIRSKIGPELAHRLETVRGVGYLWRT